MNITMPPAQKEEYSANFDFILLARGQRLKYFRKYFMKKCCPKSINNLPPISFEFMLIYDIIFKL